MGVFRERDSFFPGVLVTLFHALMLLPKATLGRGQFFFLYLEGIVHHGKAGTAEGGPRYGSRSIRSLLI